MIVALLAAALISSPTVEAPGQEPPSPVVVAPVDLDEIVVEGSRLQDATEAFIREVAAPARGRGLARWRNGVCVGVANLDNEAAQFIADRISTVAQDLGLTGGAPGCTPNIVIFATEDADALSQGFVEARPRLFRTGGSGTDRGARALREFQSNGQPVRWWTVSAPVNDETGDIAVRLPGYRSGVGDFGANDVVSYAPNVSTRAASRLTTQIVDDAKQAFVIVDVNKTGAVSALQLADYIAMVSLAQVDPTADTSGYATILNLFDDPERTEGLTHWDQAYLQGLYGATRTLKNRSSSRVEIAASIVRARHDIDRAASEGEEP